MQNVFSALDVFSHHMDYEKKTVLSNVKNGRLSLAKKGLLSHFCDTRAAYHYPIAISMQNWSSGSLRQLKLVS